VVSDRNGGAVLGRRRRVHRSVSRAFCHVTTSTLIYAPVGKQYICGIIVLICTLLIVIFSSYETNVVGRRLFRMSRDTMRMFRENNARIRDMRWNKFYFKIFGACNYYKNVHQCKHTYILLIKRFLKCPGNFVPLTACELNANNKLIRKTHECAQVNEE
jgi:hypothetical protein